MTRRNNRTPWTLVSVAALGLGAACTEKTTVEDRPTTIEDLTENPTGHYGQRFAVAGEIEKMYDPQTFVVGGTDFFDHELLVISRAPLPVADMRTEESPAVEGDIVHVTGELRRYVETEIQSELDWTLDSHLEAEFESKPVLVATSVLVSPRDPDATAMVGVAPLASPVKDITLVIATRADEVMGQELELEGMTVRSLVEDEGFWIGPSHGRQMFVHADLEEGESLKEMGVVIGQQVNIEGKLEATPDRPELESSWGLSDTQASLLDGEPMYIDADSISPTAATS